MESPPMTPSTTAPRTPALTGVPTGGPAGTVQVSPRPATPIPLNLAAPNRGRRGKPPRHFVDLTPEERVAAVTELGEKPFRAKQLATHYFTHLDPSPAAMTDLPAASRETLVKGLFPQLLTPVRTLQADGGTTVKTLWH